MKKKAFASTAIAISNEIVHSKICKWFHKHMAYVLWQVLVFNYKILLFSISKLSFLSSRLWMLLLQHFLIPQPTQYVLTQMFTVLRRIFFSSFRFLHWNTNKRKTRLHRLSFEQFSSHWSIYWCPSAFIAICILYVDAPVQYRNEMREREK